MTDGLPSKLGDPAADPLGDLTDHLLDTTALRRAERVVAHQVECLAPEVGQPDVRIGSRGEENGQVATV